MRNWGLSFGKYAKKLPASVRLSAVMCLWGLMAIDADDIYSSCRLFFFFWLVLLSTLRRSSSEDIEFPSSGWGARGDANCTLFFLEGWSILKYISAFSTCLDRWSRGSRMYAFVRGTHALLYALVLFLNRYWVKRNTYSLPHLLAVR
jgi:hypothetical protein